MKLTGSKIRRPPSLWCLFLAEELALLLVANLAIDGVSRTACLVLPTVGVPCNLIAVGSLTPGRPINRWAFGGLAVGMVAFGLWAEDLHPKAHQPVAWTLDSIAVALIFSMLGTAVMIAKTERSR